ncbi:MAG TPA: class I SAM-dependent methyltransferase [bacterium]|jgi:arsenite methyltransferase|nr:class I SAM-dependent methyltransferase [bacterium]
MEDSKGTPKYGWDGSPYRLGLFLAVTLGGASWLTASPGIFLRLAGYTLLLCGLLMCAEAAVWIFYVQRGKFLRRDRMLAMIDWTGDERVLDVGTGRGLLMIGAAKKLTRGTSVGIDIWSADDMLNNSHAATMRNAVLEGVLNRIEIKDEDARRMSFADASFDVVLSNLCIHNIPSKEGRDKACREIARVLKPGGVALISDLLFTDHYHRVFEEEGMAVTAVQPPFWEACFPGQRILKAVKA